MQLSGKRGDGTSDTFRGEVGPGRVYAKEERRLTLTGVEAITAARIEREHVGGGLDSGGGEITTSVTMPICTRACPGEHGVRGKIGVIATRDTHNRYPMRVHVSATEQTHTSQEKFT